MRIPVLAYHGVNIAGSDYAGNDHIAFANDLDCIQRMGLRVVPLQQVVDVLLGRRDPLPPDCVALSCDDGSDYDYHDLDWPGVGPVRSFHNAMTDFQFRHGHGAQPQLHMTAFVIASPQARKRIDQRCLHAADRMRDDWWRPAILSGRWAIGNHSWDHNHSALDEPGPLGMRRGDFSEVNDFERAEFQVAQAARHIDQIIAPQRSRLFCYPFGHVPDYLHREYLPQYGPAIGLDAAFSDGAAPVTPASDRWLLPRYICGWHWKQPDELERLLHDVIGRG